MKHILRSVIFTFAAFSAGTVVADWCEEFCPIFGVDYKWTHSGNRDSGLGLFPKHHHGASVYLGSRFCENFGLEVGYDWYRKSNRSITIVEDVFENVAPGLLLVPVTYTASTCLSQWRFDLNGYLPVGCEGFDLVASIGVGLAKNKDFLRETSSLAPGISFVDSQSHKTKAVFRLGLGAQYMINCNFGIRALYRWELNAVRKYDPIIEDFRKNKSIHGISAGLFFKF